MALGSIVPTPAGSVPFEAHRDAGGRDARLGNPWLTWCSWWP